MCKTWNKAPLKLKIDRELLLHVEFLIQLVHDGSPLNAGDSVEIFFLNIVRKVQDIAYVVFFLKSMFHLGIFFLQIIFALLHVRFLFVNSSFNAGFI